MAETNFLIFNEENNPDRTYNDSEYKNATQRLTGVIPGMALSRQHNKMYFQWSAMCKAIADFLVTSGYNCMDNNVEGITEGLTKTVTDMIEKDLSTHNTDNEAHKTLFDKKLDKTGGTLTGDLNASGYNITATKFIGNLQGKADNATNADLATKATIAENANNAANATHATSAANADLATKANQDSQGQTINTTYVKGVTGSNATLTVTKGNGTTSTVTINNVENSKKATQDGSGNTITTHYLSRNQSTQNDMNACIVEGIYRFSGTLKNGWTSDSWGTLLVFNNQYNGSSGVSGTYLVQIALPTDGRMWTRQRVNTGAWTSWNKLANTTDCTDTLKKVYPVGSIYMSTVSTNPATLFGFGTWEAMPAGRVLLAQGKSSWGTTYNAGSTGGEATHKLTVGELPSHGHSASTNTANLTGNANSIGINYDEVSVSGIISKNRGNDYGGTNNDHNKTGFLINASHSHTVTINNTGSNQAHNNLQPYISVYMWKRSA